MSPGRIGRAIGFDQHKSRRIVLVLKHIKARNTRFLNTGAGIRYRGLSEGINVLRFQVNVDVYDQHVVESLNGLHR